MPPRRAPSSDETIIADWDTGEYSRDHGGSKSQRDLAYKHNVSVGKISKLVKGREPSMHKVVNDLVTAKQILAEQNEQTVNSVNSVVDERTRHIQFFNQAALKNVSVAVKKVNAGTTQAEHRMVAETILKGKEVVFGKQPETVINNTNAQQLSLTAQELRRLTPEEYAVLQSATGKLIGT